MLSHVGHRARNPLLIFVTLLVSAVSAVAEPGATISDENWAPYQLLYQVPNECPPQSRFLELVNTRLEGWQAADGDAAGTLQVVVKKLDQTYWAGMTLVDPWGHVGFREFEAADCKALVSDVAVAVGPAIESQLGPRPPNWEFGVSGGTDARAGLLAWGGEGFIGLRWPLSRRGLRLALGYWRTGAGQANGLTDSRMAFELLSSRIEPCPFDIRLTHTVSIPLCLTVEAGILRARHPESDSMVRSAPWFAVGIFPRIRWAQRYTFVELGPRLDVHLYPGGIVDTQRSDPPNTASTEESHTFPLIGVAAMASIGVKLP